MAEPDARQLATVLEQIADHSSDDDIRTHLRQVAGALRGDGFIILNGPPQARLRKQAREEVRQMWNAAFGHDP